MSDLPPDMPQSSVVDDVVAGTVRFRPRYNPHDFEVEGYRSDAVEVDGLGPTSFLIEFDPGPDRRAQIADAIEAFSASAVQLLAAARRPAYEYYEAVRDRTEPAPPRVEDASTIWRHVRWWADEVSVEIDFEHGTGAHVILHGSCDWDAEHGIELVFQAGAVLTRVGDRVGNPVPMKGAT